MEFDDRDGRFTQDSSDLLAAGEVLGQPIAAEAAQIDDPANTGSPSGHAERSSQGPIACGEALTGGHGMHEVVGRVGAGERDGGDVGIADIDGSRLDAGPEGKWLAPRPIAVTWWSRLSRWATNRRPT